MNNYDLMNKLNIFFQPCETGCEWVETISVTADITELNRTYLQMKILYGSNVQA